MAKKKPLFGVSNYHKRTPKKRPGVHTKRLNKRKPHRKKYRFEIFQSCDTWFHTNVKVLEQKKRKLFSNHVYHEYKGKQVIGYICSDEPPQ